MAVTDHDTTAAVAEVQALARARGIEAISGIEITAVDAGGDVHVLGYFIDPGHAGLSAFLARQRAARVARVEAIGQRLAALGVPIDLEAAARRRAPTDRAIDRPAVDCARDGGGRLRRRHPRGIRPVARAGPPGVRAATGRRLRTGHRHHSRGRRDCLDCTSRQVGNRRPHRVAARQGLDAIEAFHPDHDAALVQHYVQRCRARSVC